jgi:hypothetical protein
MADKSLLDATWQLAPETLVAQALRSVRLNAVNLLADAEAVPGIDSITISIPIGEHVGPLPHALRYLGSIFAHADSSSGQSGAASGSRSVGIRYSMSVVPAFVRNDAW